MSCRCADIRRCGRDISRLYRIIGRIQRISGKKHDLISLGNEIHTMQPEAYELDEGSRGIIQSSLCKNEVEFDRKIEEYICYLNRRVASLEREQRSMEYEDEDYHDDDD